MLWHIFKYYLGFVIHVFFKKANASNIHYLKVKGPVILAVNHPNAFMDPVALSALVYPPRLRYLARGDAFKNKAVAAFLNWRHGAHPLNKADDEAQQSVLYFFFPYLQSLIH